MSTGVTITLIICATVAVIWVSSMITAVFVAKVKGKKKEEDNTDVID